MALQSVKDREQVIPIRVRWMNMEIAFVLITRLREAFPWPGNPGRGHEVVVLQKPHKNATQYPGRSRLRTSIGPPVFIVLSRSRCRLRSRELVPQFQPNLRQLRRLASLEQVVFELLEQFLKVRSGELSG